MLTSAGDGYSFQFMRKIAWNRVYLLVLGTFLSSTYMLPRRLIARAKCVENPYIDKYVIFCRYFNPFPSITSDCHDKKVELSLKKFLPFFKYHFGNLKSDKGFVFKREASR